LKAIQKLIGKQIPVVENHPFPASTSNVVKINLPKNKDVVKRPNAIQNNTPNKKRFNKNNNNNNRPKPKPNQERW